MADWAETTLGELIAQGDGELQTGPFGTVLKASEYSRSGAPVVSVGEIRVGRIQLSDRTPRVSDVTKQRLPQFVLEEGDIVFGRKGGIDRNALVGLREHGWFLGSDGIRLRLSGSVDSCFVSYQFRLRAIGRWLLGNSAASIMPSLNEGMLLRLPLRLPKLKEQQKIGAVLAALDAKIDLNNRINAELEALAKTIYDYWFVQFDFPDAHGRPYRSSGGAMVWNDTLKREIPARWGADNIRAVAEVGGGGTPSKSNATFWNGNIPFFSPVDAADAMFQLDTTDHITQKGLDACSSDAFPKGTIFITARGSVGKVVITGRSMVMNQSCYALRPRAETFLPFLYFHARTMVLHLKVKASGSTFNSIVTNDIEWTNLVVPSDSMIEAFGTRVRPMFDRIEAGLRENAELTRLRDWLLPLLMNGQVHVA